MVLQLLIRGATLLTGAWIGLGFLSILGLPLGWAAFRGLNNYTTRITAYIAMIMLLWDATISRNREMKLWEGGLIAGSVIGYSAYSRGVVG